MRNNLLFTYCRKTELWLQVKRLTEPDVVYQNYCTAPSLRTEYINSGVKYHPNPTPGYDVRRGIGIQTKTYLDDGISEVFIHLMNFAPYRSVWVDSDCNGVKDPLVNGAELTISKNITLSHTKTIYVGLMGDNKFILKVDGELIVDVLNIDVYNFVYLHFFPVTLTAGQHLLSFTGIGDGSVNDSLGVIVLDNPIEDIMLPVPRAEWNVLYSSEESLSGSTDIVTCPVNYSYDSDSKKCISILDADNLVSGDTILFTPTGIPTGGVFNWTMDYGDNVIDTGTGSAAQTFEHQYDISGTYHSSFTAISASGVVIKGNKQIIIS